MKKLLLLFLAGWSAAMGQDAVLCVFFDLSQSAQNVRTAYGSDFEKILGGLAGGEHILGAGITAQSLATGRFEIDEVVPKYSPFTDSKLTFRKRLQNSQSAVKRGADKLLAAPASSATDIMGATQLAEKVFQSSGSAAAKIRLLILFSDMVEDSARYNFEKENLTPARATAIVESERKAGRLPSLKGVQVWVSGAGGSAPERFLQIQDFWIRYFQAAGADLSKSHYGAGLMDFSIRRP